MAKQVYDSDEIMKELKVGKARLSQLVNGYTTSKGVHVPPLLIEGEDYTWERRTVKASNRELSMRVRVFTKEGVKKLRTANKKPGRPRKEET